MIGIKVRIDDNTKAVQQALDKANFRNLGHAAASIAKDEKASFEKAPQGDASQPGTPPHTHRGQYIKRGVRFDVQGDSAVIGPQASVVGEAAAVHEFGEVFHGVDYPERPFAGPALERAVPRLGGEWAGSIGS